VIRRLVCVYRPFAKNLLITATSNILTELSRMFETSNVNGINLLLSEYNASTNICFGPRFNVLVDNTNFPRRHVSFDSSHVVSISASLKQLAENSEMSTISICEHGISRDGELTVTFCKLDKVPTIERQYEPSTPGSTWEAVVKHSRPRLDQLKMCFQSLVDWSETETSDLERCVIAVSEEGEEQVPHEVAFSRLISLSDSVYQVNIYADIPLTVPYGSPYTGCQVWFYQDVSEIILSEHNVATGDFKVDIANFFLYRKLFLEVTKNLCGTSIAWGDCADGWGDDKFRPIESLQDVEILYEIFCDTLEPSLGNVKIPELVKKKFFESYSQRKF
jgi:hypothetical protein